ncbi:hypothetical protein TIFTF001_011491 [Ficus carica]|uniref:Uncharacterized protein n=1 Tax=Ficus carica TaxID=3494 RepID=A0AA88D0S2_FICCA|nr:hypothetical protein TIFTF001_011491 [Ficus carica]
MGGTCRGWGARWGSAGAGAGGGGGWGASQASRVGYRRPSPAVKRSPVTEKTLGGKGNMSFFFSFIPTAPLFLSLHPLSLSPFTPQITPSLSPFSSLSLPSLPSHRSADPSSRSHAVTPPQALTRLPLFCCHDLSPRALTSQLVPLPSPASKVPIATSYLRSCPYVRDPANGASLSPNPEPKPRAPPSSASEAPIKLTQRRSGDREREDPNLFHSRSLAPAVERRLTMMSFAQSSSGVEHRISTRDCIEQEIHSNLICRF